MVVSRKQEEAPGWAWSCQNRRNIHRASSLLPPSSPVGAASRDRWVPALDDWWAVGTCLMAPLTGWTAVLINHLGHSGMASFCNSQVRGELENYTVKPGFGDHGILGP